MTRWRCFELSWELQPHPSIDMRKEWHGGETHRNTRSAGKQSPKQKLKVNVVPNIV